LIDRWMMHEPDDFGALLPRGVMNPDRLRMNAQSRAMREAVLR
jgi:hypothetical protein